jgi:hypothetical protein
MKECSTWNIRKGGEIANDFFRLFFTFGKKIDPPKASKSDDPFLANIHPWTFPTIEKQRPGAFYPPL